MRSTDRRSIGLGAVVMTLLVNEATSWNLSPAASARTGLHRGKILEQVAAPNLYAAYKEVQTDYQTKAFGSDKAWKLLKDQDGVKVSSLCDPLDPSCPYVRMNAVIHTPPNEIFDWMSLPRWDETMPKMDPFYEGLDIAGHFEHDDVSMSLVRKRSKPMVAFGKRDFSVVSVADVPRDDGTWVSGTVSVITDRLPRIKGYTRGFQDSISFFKPIGTNKTNLTIVSRLDLNDSGKDGEGGAIPMCMYVKSIGTTAARCILNLRHHLAEERHGRIDQHAESLADDVPLKQEKLGKRATIARFLRLGRSRKQLHHSSEVQPTVLQ